MSRACRPRAVSAGRALALLLALLALLGPAEARRKKKGKGKRGDEAAQVEPERPERPPRGGHGERPPRDERPERVAPAACSDAGCEAGVKLSIEEDGTPPRPVPAFRYRVRLGDQRLDGSCPRAKDEGPPVARCLPSGLLVPFVPAELDVAVEAAGLRPLLQTLSPQYETRGGCCQRADVRLLLRREAPP